MADAKISTAPMNEKNDAEDLQRRNVALALLGMFGGAALVQGCEASSSAATAEGTCEVTGAVVGTSSIVWVDTIADLSAVTGEGTTAALKSTVIVLGYSTRGDGGGGIFSWVKATPPAAGNGGTIFLPTSQPSSPNGPGYWQRIYSGPIDIRWFGASTGLADNRPPILNAIKAAMAAGGSGAVMIPAGTYAMTSSLILQGADMIGSLVIAGVGYASRITANIPGTNTAAISITISPTNRTDVEISDLRIDGSFSRAIEIVGPPPANAFPTIRIARCNIAGATVSASPAGVVAAIFLFQVNDAWVVDNTLSGNGVAGQPGFEIVKYATNPLVNARIHVRGNKITGSNTTIAVAIYDANDSDVIGNSIDQGNHGDGAASGYGVMIYDNTHTNILYRNVVNENHIRNAAGIGIYLAGSNHSIANANVLENVVLNQVDTSLPVGGIAANGFCNIISNNTIKTSGKAGIGFSSDHNVVANNYIESTTTSGIWVDGSASNTTISGNVLRSVGSHGILIDPVAGNCLRIIGNTIDASNGDGIAGALNNSVIIGNHVQATTGTGIGVGLGTRNAIANNTVINGSSGGIEVRSDHTVVQGNIVNGCAGVAVASFGLYVQLRDNELFNSGGSVNLSNGTSMLRSGNRFSEDLVFSTAQLTAGAVQVPTNEVKAGDRVRIDRTSFANPVSATGVLAVTAVNDGNFSVQSSSATDNGQFKWEIVH